MQRNQAAMFLQLKKVFVALVVLCAADFIAKSAAYLHENDAFESVEPEVEKRALPAIKWDGVCPQKSARCPTSFQGIPPPLIIVSLDGFRPDYLQRGFTPTLSNIASCGTKARHMYPVFPSKTFPNHYSQVTGLNPSSHGIIDNSMYDANTRKLFKVGRPESEESFWWEKEPIWVTARRQGKITASYYWPGSEVVINGSQPTYWKKYSAKITFEDRVDQVLAWLDLPVNSRPNFITLYVNQPDNAAHWDGTKSRNVNNALAKVDKMIARLFSGLQQRNLINCINVVIMSDHGMSDIDCKLSVDISKFVDLKDTYVTMGPFGRVRPKGKRNTTMINDMLSKLQCKSPHMRAYAKERLPVRMHFAEHTRIEPIFLDMDAEWTVVSSKLLHPIKLNYTSGRCSKSSNFWHKQRVMSLNNPKIIYKHGIRKAEGEICTGGAHGYDNMFPDMRALFIAYGPAFKRNYVAKPFINTELYEMFSELINIKPNPNNGTKGSLHHIMTSPRALLPQVEPDPPSIGEVPQDETEYKYRLLASNCPCSQKGKRQTQVENIPLLRDFHVPFGMPFNPEDNNTLRLLYNEDYITAFDLKYRIPMWSAFTLKGKKNVTKLDEVCWRGDARIPINDAANCGDYERNAAKRNFVQQRPLYSPAFSNSSASVVGASYVTNSLPKSLNYTKILEKPMNQLLAKWAAQSGELNVVTGPAFDLSATGLRPPIGKLMKLHDRNGPLMVSTHIFFVATWCGAKGVPLKSCSPAKLENHAFLLPNQPYTNNCESAAKVIEKNVARVVDIEKLTGLSLYTGLPIYDAIRLRTAIPERTM